MKINNLLIASSLLASVLVSCVKKNDPEPAPASKPLLKTEESESLLKNTASSATSDVKSMSECEGIVKMQALASIQNNFSNAIPSNQRVSQDNFKSSLFSINGQAPLLLFKRILITNPVSTTNAREGEVADTLFDFKSNLGTYTWNNNTKEWDKTSNPSTITLIFPSDSLKMNTNDAKLVIKNYAEKIYDTETFPTSMIAEFTVNGVIYASVNYTGEFSNEGLPTLLNFKAYLKPWNYHSESKDLGSSISSGYKIFKDGESPITSSSMNITFEGGDKEKPLKASGFVQYRDLKIEGNVNAKEIQAQSQTDDTTGVSDEQLNSWIDFDILRNSDNAKLADIYLQAESEDNPIIIKFNDGTSKSPEDYFQDTIDELEAFMKDYGLDENKEPAPVNTL